MTPRELLARPPQRQPRRTCRAGTLRVVPNQFPVLRVEGTLDRQGEGLFDKMNGIGAHEVIIESPRHVDTLADDGRRGDRAGAVGLRASACRTCKQDRRFRYIIIFKNHGAAAGASLDHSHSQLIALPIVPREVRDEVDGARAHFAGEGALRLLRHPAAGDARRPAADCGECRHGGGGAVRAAVSVRDVDAAAAPPGALRGCAAP